jgi:Acetyltransferase (GNAT) domain
MKLSARRISLIENRQEMLELLNRNFEPGQETRFEWRHINNPVGEAWAWFLYDGSKAAVGTVAVFPRRVYVDGKQVVCGQVGGFAVDASHRSLGPAVLLQRTTFEPVDSGTFAFCFDCPPHDRGMSTFVRLGMRSKCAVTRYALLLRSDNYVEIRFGRGAWTKPVIAAANLFLRMRSTRRHVSGVEITSLDAAFGEEFSDLDKRVSSTGTIRTSRSAELLNWRHVENPGSGFRVLVARRAGELLGFLAFTTCEGRAYIGDLFGLELAATGPALLDAAIDVCRRESISSLHGFCSEDSGLRTLFVEAGFRPRETEARVVPYEKSDGGSAKLLSDGLRWSFGSVDLMI